MKCFQNFSNIESAYDFMKAWKSLKNDTDLKVHAQLLRSLNVDKLSSGVYFDKI